MNKWPKNKLKNLCTRIGDGLHGTPKYTESGDIFFINGNELRMSQKSKIRIKLTKMPYLIEIIDINFEIIFT